MASNGKGNTCEKALLYLSWFVAVITFPFSLFACVIIIAEYSRAVIFRMGRLRKRNFGPGMAWVLPCIDEVHMIELRTRVMKLPMQELITKDSVTINVDAVLFFSIYNTDRSVIYVQSPISSIQQYGQVGVRNLVGITDFHELVKYRDLFSKKITEDLAKVCDRWGVRIERVDLMEIRLSELLQRSLAQEAESKREAQAKIISAEGEKEASTALKEASDVMTQTNITLQLRQLQSLTALARDGALTIIYPFPMEMMGGFNKSGGGSSKKDNNDCGPQRCSLGMLLSTMIVKLLKSDIMAGEKPQEPAQSQPSEDPSNPTNAPRNSSPSPSEGTAFYSLSNYSTTRSTQTDFKV